MKSMDSPVSYNMKKLCYMIWLVCLVACQEDQKRNPYQYIRPESGETKETKELTRQDSLHLQARVMTCVESNLGENFGPEITQFEDALLQVGLLPDTSALGYRHLFVVTLKKRDSVLNALTAIPRKKLSKKAYTSCLLRKYSGIKGKNVSSELNQILALYTMFDTPDFESIEEEYLKKQEEVLRQLTTDTFRLPFIRTITLLDLYFLKKRVSQ